jgi:hypothetical protein
MILTPGVKLEAVLAGAITTSQPEVHVSYRLYNTAGEKTKPTLYRTVLNSTTDVTLILDQSGGAIPQQGFVLEILSLNIYNKDTVSATVTVKTDDGTTERIVRKVTLLTLETLSYQKDEGWYATDANGNRKNSTGPAYATGSFTGTLTGCTTSPTGTIFYTIIGNQVTLDIPQFTGTSNATTKTITGAPSAIFPTTQKRMTCISVDNGGAGKGSLFQIATSGVISYFNADGAFTNSGSFVGYANSVTYTMN